FFFFFFSSRRRHTRFKCDWSSDVCSSDLARDVDRFAPIVTFHRAVERKSNSTHAGNGGQRIAELGIKDVKLLGCVSCHMRIDMQDVTVGQLESEFLVVQVAQAFSQQSRGAEENERQRSLYDD